MRPSPEEAGWKMGWEELWTSKQLVPPGLPLAFACPQGTDGVEPKETAPLGGRPAAGDERIPHPDSGPGTEGETPFPGPWLPFTSQCGDPGWKEGPEARGQEGWATEPLLPRCSGLAGTPRMGREGKLVSSLVGAS